MTILELLVLSLSEFKSPWNEIARRLGRMKALRLHSSCYNDLTNKGNFFIDLAQAIPYTSNT